MTIKVKYLHQPRSLTTFYKPTMYVVYVVYVVYEVYVVYVVYVTTTYTTYIAGFEIGCH